MMVNATVGLCHTAGRKQSINEPLVLDQTDRRQSGSSNLKHFTYQDQRRYDDVYK